MPYKPDDYPSVSPYLLVEDASEAIRFLDRTFDAEITREFEDNGSVTHVEVRVDDSIIMMGEPDDPSRIEPSMVHVYVEDVDAVFDRAVLAGGDIIQKPVQKEGEPDKRGGLTGPSGHIWWIATQLD